MAIDDTVVPQLFRHTKRPAWGYAVLAGELPKKRRYQFQDGQLREIRDGFYHLLEPVDQPLDIAMRIANELESQVVTADRRRKALKDNPKLIPFDDQVKAFKHLYPGGFEDETYTAQLRGRDASRRLKKMRDPAIADAQAQLSEDVLKAAIDTGDGGAIQEAVLDVLTSTDLVTRTDLDPFRGLTDSTALDYAKALYNAVYSEARLDNVTGYFEALRRSFGKGTKVSWPALTALPSLLAPNEFVPVKASAFREQSKWMAPGMQLPTDSSGSMYGRLLRMAMSVRDRLEKSEMTANDYIDVFEFITVTMRPKGRQLIAELRGE